MPLDDKDRHILAQLDKNGRMSLAAIGREIGLSRNAVRDRITRMEDTGVILGFRVVQGRGGAGPDKALIFVKIKDWPNDAALEWLVKLPGMRRMWAIGAEWDAIMTVTVAGPADLNRLCELINRNPMIDRSIGHMVYRAL